jgi:hypothetical protein
MLSFFHNKSWFTAAFYNQNFELRKIIHVSIYLAWICLKKLNQYGDGNYIRVTYHTGFPLYLNKSWDGSQVPSWYFMLLMRIFRFKLIRIKSFWRKDHHFPHITQFDTLGLGNKFVRNSTLLCYEPPGWLGIVVKTNSIFIRWHDPRKPK